ncbi:MAG: TrkA family potassium uptake protein [Firmicutes bacterium]|nr:TrkA family potassium uptake protein [Bacillota bacterium]
MKSVLLIGTNRFGSLLARQFHELGHHVMAVDKDEKRINDVLPYVTDAQIGDSTNEAFLRSLDISGYDVCIVTIGGDFQSSLETTSLLKELGGRLVVSRADREVQAKFLLRNGADEVINPEKQIAEWAAIRYGSDHILDYIKLDDDHAIFEVTVPREWSGRNIGQIDIRKKYGINIMAVKENGKMLLSITPETVLDSGMTMLVLGEQRAIRKCFRL